MTATFTPPLAALTTVFTPPCPITWLLTTTKVPSQFPPFPTGAPASCDPPSWDEYVTERGFEYYSPAICPSGFFVGPSCIITNPRTAQGFPAIQGGETAAYCIPTGHTCTSDTSDFRGGVWGVSRTAAETGAQVTVGPAIQIRWRAEDLDGLETDPLTPGARSTSTTAEPLPTETTATEATSTSSPEPEPTSTEEPPPPPPPSSTEATTAIVNRPGPLLGFTTLPSKSTTLSTRSTSTSSSPSPSSSPSSSPLLASSPTSQPSSTQEIPTDPTPSLSASQSGGQIGNSTTAPAQQDADKNSSNRTTMSNFTIAATVLTTILISLIAGYGTYSFVRQYRRYRRGETNEFFLFLWVFKAEAWVRRRLRIFHAPLRRWNSNHTTSTEGEKAEARRWKIPDAELGTEGPLTELGDTKPFGTKENPAELPMPATPTTTPERWSWRSRVSRILPARTARNGSVASGS